MAKVLDDSEPDPAVLEGIRGLQREQHEKLAALRDLLQAQDVRSLLAYLAFYQVAHEEGVDPEVAPRGPAGQVQAELVQALALGVRGPSFTGAPTDHKDGMAIAELARDVTTLGLFSHMVGADGDLVQALQARARSITASVRNLGYPPIGFDIVRRLLAPLDDELEDDAGWRVSDLLDLILWIAEQIEERLNDHVKKMGRVLRKKGKPGMVRAFREEFPAEAERWADALEAASTRLSPANCRNGLWGMAETRLPSIFTFSEEELREAHGGAGAGTCAVLRDLSYEWGELADLDPTHVLITNPVHERPFIREQDGYFIPVIGSVTHAPLGLVERMVPEKWRDRVDRRRARFLEDEAAALLEAAFPAGTVYVGNHYEVDVEGASRRVENDIIVRVGSSLLAVECKAGHVSPSARRGGQERLKSEVRELVVEPGDQVNRLRRVLSERGEVEIESSDGSKVTIKSSEVRQFLGLSLVLEDSLGLMGPVREFKESGLVDRVPKPPVPHMSLHDLRVLLDLMPCEAATLHYLQRRAEWEDEVWFLGDETDLLAHYLHTGLNRRPDGGARVILAGMSKELDGYYGPFQDKDRPPVPPQLRLKGWWGEVVRAFTTRAPSEALDAAEMLLSVDWEGGERLERVVRKRIRQLRQGAEKEYPVAFHHAGELGGRSGGVVVLALRPKDVGTEVEETAFNAFLNRSDWEVGVCVTVSDIITGRPYDHVTVARPSGVPATDA